MSQVLVTESYLEDIADAIREKNGTETTYKPPQMAAAIEALPDPSVLDDKTITSNGTYDAGDDDLDGYSEVTVNVPNSYAAGDEGKVVSNGALVAQTARSSDITENGTYDTTLNDEVTVAVSGGGGGGTAKETLMTQGQVSTTSAYATANFSGTIDFSKYLIVKVDLWRSGSIIGTGWLDSSGTFNIYGSDNRTYTMIVSTTSISCTYYQGSYVDLYVDVYGYKVSGGGGGNDV